MLNNRRVLAGLIDLYISYVVVLGFFILLKYKILLEFPDWDYFSTISNITWLASIILKDLIFKNASIGKKLMKLEIKDCNGNIPKFYIIILRNIFTPILYCIEFVMILGFGNKFTDYIFKTKVVETR